MNAKRLSSDDEEDDIGECSCVDEILSYLLSLTKSYSKSYYHKTSKTKFLLSLYDFEKR